MKKYSLVVVLVLALSLALSTVSVSAEELDIPVHEDPIDEIQYANGSSSKYFSKQLELHWNVLQVFGLQ